LHYFHHCNDYWNYVDGKACKVPSGDLVHVVDLWQTNLEQPGLQGPAHGYNNSCIGGMAGGNGNAEPSPDDFGSGDRIGDTCYRHGPKSDHWYGGYEDALFEQQVLRTVAEHNPATPYFLFWAPHIVHTPLQVPDEFFQKFAFVAENDKPTHERQTYHAMVDFADAAIGNFTEAIKAKGMWDDMIIVFSAGTNERPLCSERRLRAICDT
jgi:arylsulfatase A-like enzyme